MKNESLAQCNQYGVSFTRSVILIKSVLSASTLPLVLLGNFQSLHSTFACLSELSISLLTERVKEKVECKGRRDKQREYNLFSLLLLQLTPRLLKIQLTFLNVSLI